MKIGILGAGSMGGSIIKGLIQKYNSSDIFVMNPSNPRVTKMKNKLGFNLFNDYNSFIENELDILFITTPAPTTLKILNNFKNLNQQTIIISAAAEIKAKNIQTILPHNPIIPIIPNTPVSINQGTIVSSFDVVNDDVEQKATKILNALGDVIKVPESQIDIAGVIGGCGPAFIDQVMDAMGDAAVAKGLDRNTAYQAIASMVSGSGQLAKQTKKSPATLKDEVTSPGGLTIKGVTAMEKANFRKPIIDAINNANGNN